MFRLVSLCVGAGGGRFAGHADLPAVQDLRRPSRCRWRNRAGTTSRALATQVQHQAGLHFDANLPRSMKKCRSIHRVM